MPNIIVKVGSHRRILEKLLTKTRGIIRVASAYVTDKELLLGSNAEEVRLLIPLSKMDIVVGATSLDCLRLLLERGVKCRVLTAPPKFHAKVYIFNSECAVVTSANLTTSGFDKNIEVGVLLRGRASAKLIAWFDERWASEVAEPLSNSCRHQAGIRFTRQLECTRRLCRNRRRRNRQNRSRRHEILHPATARSIHQFQ
jgi:PLD-like domain